MDDSSKNISSQNDNKYIQQNVHVEIAQQGKFYFLFIIFKNIMPSYYRITLADYLNSAYNKTLPKKGIFKRIFNTEPVLEDYKMNYQTGDVRYKLIVDTGHLDFSKEEAAKDCVEKTDNAINAYRDAVLRIMSETSKSSNTYMENVTKAFEYFKDLKIETNSMINEHIFA